MEMMKWIQNREKRITFELDSDNTWRYLSSVHCVQASLKTNGNLCFAQNFGKRSVNDSPGRFHSVIVFFSAVKKNVLSFLQSAGENYTVVDPTVAVPPNDWKSFQAIWIESFFSLLYDNCMNRNWISMFLWVNNKQQNSY